MTKDNIKQLVIDYAYGYAIDPAVALAQAERESNFNPNAVGGSGERGLMQFMPGTWARFSDRPFEDAFDIDYNLTAWGNYMQYLLNLFGWDRAGYEKALTGYNGGEGHLTNPGRYGPPSARAQTYAREILTKANYGAPDIVTVAGGQPPPPMSQSESQITTLVLLGIAAFGVLLLVRN